MTIDEIHLLYPGISWINYINNFLDNPFVELHMNDSVILDNPMFLVNLSNILPTIAPRVQANFLITRGISKWMDEMMEIDREARDIWNKFNMVEAEEGDNANLTDKHFEQCVDKTASKLPIAVSSMYVRRYFETEGKSILETMVGNIKEAFKEMINEYKEGKVCEEK